MIGSAPSGSGSRGSSGERPAARWPRAGGHLRRELRARLERLAARAAATGSPPALAILTEATTARPRSMPRALSVRRERRRPGVHARRRLARAGDQRAERRPARGRHRRGPAVRGCRCRSPPGRGHRPGQGCRRRDTDERRPAGTRRARVRAGDRAGGDRDPRGVRRPGGRSTSRDRRTLGRRRAAGRVAPARAGRHGGGLPYRDARTSPGDATGRDPRRGGRRPGPDPPRDGQSLGAIVVDCGINATPGRDRPAMSTSPGCRRWSRRSRRSPEGSGRSPR